MKYSEKELNDALPYNLQELVETLKMREVSRVFVAGPQRSGTTIVAKMLAEDLGFAEIQELLHLDAANNLRPKAVAQCPQITSRLHEICAPNSVVIFMCRSLKDIIASGARIGWNNTHEVSELNYYKELFPEYFVEGYHLSAIAQNVWLSYQMPRMQIPFFNLPYNNLKDHPLYVPKAKRKKFEPKQTTPKL